MDMFKAQQRDAALQLQKANKPDEPKYSFKTEMVPVASPPDFEVLSRGLSDSKIISLDDEGVDPLTIADEQARIIDSIEENGFMTLGGNEAITLAGTPGTDQPDFVTDAVSVAQRYDGKKYLVLGGNTTEPVIETTDMEPEPGTKVVEVIDPTGVDYDKRWRIQTGEQTTPKVKAYRITDPESIAYFESLGKAFRKNVDIEDVNIMETDESVANMRLGLAIFTLKFKNAQSSSATPPFKSNIFSESDIREAQRVVNKYKFEF